MAQIIAVADFFAAYGMTEEDIIPQYLSFSDSAEALKDGKIEAAFIVAGASTPAVTDLAADKGCYLVGLAAELDLEFASTCGLPYHEGAARYFAEKGIEVETAK